VQNDDNRRCDSLQMQGKRRWNDSPAIDRCVRRPLLTSARQSVEAMLILLMAVHSFGHWFVEGFAIL